jgi:hypothetical protein
MLYYLFISYYRKDNANNRFIKLKNKILNQSFNTN